MTPERERAAAPPPEASPESPSAPTADGNGAATDGANGAAADAANGAANGAATGDGDSLAHRARAALRLLLRSLFVRRAWILLRRRIALVGGTDVEGTTRRITGNILLDGEAPWMLVCSALLASIGLDVGSAAVIIGAMLISPLMSPILGVGLAIGVADRRLLLRGATELGFATGASLLTSTVYFALSPLAEPTTELIARTTPTLLDVGVAFFGGVAGIVAGSRRDQSLALPGVAIATALMPPLCTAGFGLATGRPAFFFGAFYLFVLNAIFIALATFSVVRLLKFPLRTFASPEARQHEKRIIGAVATVAVLPSLWFLYNTVQGQRERARLGAFVDDEIAARGHDVIRWDQRPEGDSTVIKVFVAGEPITAAELDTIVGRLPDYALRRVRVQPVQSDISGSDLAQMQTDLREGVLQMIAASQASRDSVARATVDSVRRAQAVRDSVDRLRNPARDSGRVRSLAAELRSTFPEIAGIAWAPIADLLAADSIAPPPTLYLSFDRAVPTAKRREIVERADALTRARLGSDSVRVESR